MTQHKGGKKRDPSSSPRSQHMSVRHNLDRHSLLQRFDFHTRDLGCCAGGGLVERLTPSPHPTTLHPYHQYQLAQHTSPNPPSSHIPPHCAPNAASSASESVPSLPKLVAKMSADTYLQVVGDDGHISLQALYLRALPAPRDRLAKPCHLSLSLAPSLSPSLPPSLPPLSQD